MCAHTEGNGGPPVAQTELLDEVRRHAGLKVTSAAERHVCPRPRRPLSPRRRIRTGSRMYECRSDGRGEGRRESEQAGPIHRARQCRPSPRVCVPALQTALGILSLAAYPPDEAATRAKLEFRIQNAPQYFYVLLRGCVSGSLLLCLYSGICYCVWWWVCDDVWDVLCFESHSVSARSA